MKWALIILLALILLVTWIDASQDCMKLAAPWPGGNKCTLLKFIFDWQTILASLAALVAAAIGAAMISKQIRQSDEQERERLKRKHTAARAMLPIALNALTQYALECAAQLKMLYPKLDEQILDPMAIEAFRQPKIPTAASNDLQAMVEFAMGFEGDAIASLLSKVQVHYARLSGINNERDSSGYIVSRDNLDQYILDSAEIFAQAGRLFAFARREDTEPPSGDPSRNDIKGALSAFGMIGYRFRGVLERWS